MPLYRLRVGERRACYAVILDEREVFVLFFDERETGYGPLRRRALARLRWRVR